MSNKVLLVIFLAELNTEEKFSPVRNQKNLQFLVSVFSYSNARASDLLSGDCEIKLHRNCFWSFALLMTREPNN